MIIYVDCDPRYWHTATFYCTCHLMSLFIHIHSSHWCYLDVSLLIYCSKHNILSMKHFLSNQKAWQFYTLCLQIHYKDGFEITMCVYFMVTDRCLLDVHVLEVKLCSPTEITHRYHNCISYQTCYNEGVVRGLIDIVVVLPMFTSWTPMLARASSILSCTSMRL